MVSLLSQHKVVWMDTTFLVSFFFALFLFISSLFVNFAAGTYASSHQSGSVSDIILDFLPVVNVEDIFIEGFYIFVALVICTMFFRPHYIPFTIKSIALFVFIRSGFIVLTHIGPSPHVITLDPSFLFQKVNFTGDLFFSGHTGLPFLLSLIFWEHKKIRMLFLFAAMLFGITVLLGHLHYSIDVFAAFFITYTIFAIAKKFFAKDWVYANNPKSSPNQVYP
jgi:membrane-associated phospholipid phosphatase